MLPRKSLTPIYAPRTDTPHQLACTCTNDQYSTIDLASNADNRQLVSVNATRYKKKHAFSDMGVGHPTLAQARPRAHLKMHYTIPKHTCFPIYRTLWMLTDFLVCRLFADPGATGLAAPPKQMNHPLCSLHRYPKSLLLLPHGVLKRLPFAQSCVDGAGHDLVSSNYLLKTLL